MSASEVDAWVCAAGVGGSEMDGKGMPKMERPSGRYCQDSQSGCEASVIKVLGLQKPSWIRNGRKMGAINEKKIGALLSGFAVQLRF